MPGRPATLSLALLLCVIYLAAALWQVRTGPAGTFDPADLFRLRPKTLFAFGALLIPSGPGDLWRLVAAPLLHVDAQHLGVNVGLLLLFGGGLRPLRLRGLEAAQGGARLLLTFALGGIGGGLAGLLAYRHVPTLCVGASGAVLAVIAAGLAACRDPPLARALSLLCVACLLASGALLQGDNAAHLAGLLLGALSGMVPGAGRVVPRQDDNLAQ